MQTKYRHEQRPQQLNERARYVLGADLSLTQTGLCALPMDWGADWTRPRTLSFGTKLRRDATEAERAWRVASIANFVMRTVDDYRPELVVIEQYAFSRVNSQAHALGELGGVVKHKLWKAGVPFLCVNASEARALLGKGLGKKVAAHAEAYRMGAPCGWNADELDAFIVANWGVMHEGGAGLYWEGVAS